MKQKPYILLILALQSMLLGGCTFMKYMKNYNKSINEKIEKGEVESFQDVLHFGTDYAKQIVTQEEKQKLAEAFAKAQNNFESESYPRAMLSVNDAIDMANRNNDAEFLAKAFFLKAQIGKKYSFKVENGQFLYANDGVIKINLYHRLALSAAEASKDTLFMAKILRDSADTHLMRYTLPTPEEFWQKGNFITAFNALGKQRYAGYHAALDLYQKKDVFSYEALLDSMANANTLDIDVASLNHLYKTIPKPEKKLLALWRTSYIYTQYIEHNNDFQYDMKHSRPLIDSIQKIHKTAYPLAEKLQDRNKQLQLMWRYVKTLEWQGNIEQALIENGKYAALCNDTLQWANTLYAELYGAKYRRDSLLEDLNMATLSFLNAFHPQHGQPLDTLPQIALLDSMLQYWDCEQTLIYGKKLLAMKEKKYGIAYCYHVLMKLGDCEKEAGNWEVAKKYYAKASNIYVMVNGDFVNHSIWVETLGSYSLPTNCFFLPNQLRWGNNTFLQKNIKIHHSSDSLSGYFSKQGFNYLVRHDNTIIANKLIWLKEASRKWDYIELNEVQGKDTVKWIKVLFDLLEIHRGMIGGGQKDSTIFYFQQVDTLCQLSKDTITEMSLHNILLNASADIQNDRVAQNYMRRYARKNNNWYEKYSPGYNDKTLAKIFLENQQLDSAYYYIMKAYNTNKGEEKPFFKTWDDFFLHLSLQFFYQNSYEKSHKLIHIYKPYESKHILKYILLSELHKKVGNIDSLGMYKLLLGQESKSTYYTMPTYQEEHLYYNAYQDISIDLDRKVLGDMIVNLGDRNIKEALAAQDTLAAFNIAYHALVVACENYKWEDAAKFADIARGFVEDSTVISTDNNTYYKDIYYDISDKSVHKVIYKLKQIPIYKTIHPNYIETDSMFFRFIGLSYVRLANELLKEQNNSAYLYLIKAGRIAEYLHDNKAKVAIGIVLSIPYRWEDTTRYPNNPAVSYLKNFSSDIDTSNNNIYYRYTKIKVVESKKHNKPMETVDWFGKHKHAEWSEYTDYMPKRLNGQADRLEFIDWKDMATFWSGYIEETQLPTNYKKLMLKNWTAIIEEPDGDWAVPEYYDIQNKDAFNDAIIWAFQKYQTQIEQKTDSLNTAIHQATIQKNIAEKSTEIANQKTAEVAQKNAELAGASLLIQAKSDSVILQNTIIATNNQTLDSQNNELVIIKSSLEKTNQKITDQVVEVTRLKDNAVDREKVTKTYMQGAFAAASLFLIAFFAAFVFYRKSQKEKQQVEKQKTEITAKNVEITQNNQKLIYQYEVANEQRRILTHGMKDVVSFWQRFIKDMFPNRDFEAEYSEHEPLVRLYWFMDNFRNLKGMIFHLIDSQRIVKEKSIHQFFQELLAAIKETSANEKIELISTIDIETLDYAPRFFVSYILWEAITNAYKHAFLNTKVQNPTIEVRFTQNDDIYCLTIEDNGCGADKYERNNKLGRGQGQDIINRCTNWLSNGSWNIKSAENGNGTIYEITFNH